MLNTKHQLSEFSSLILSMSESVKLTNKKENDELLKKLEIYEIINRGNIVDMVKKLH
jgi:hypothetical protein